MNQVPGIMYLELPTAVERSVAASISQNLHSLGKFANQFMSDVSLFDYAYSNKRSPTGEINAEIFSWMFVAARDGALSIFHFGRTMFAFDGLVQRCPTLIPYVNTKTLRQAREMFVGGFPEFERVRNGVAHAADFTKTPERMKKNSATYFPDHFKVLNFGAALHLNGVLSGRSYLMTVEDQAVSYELDQKNCDLMAEIADLANFAFDGAAAHTVKLANSRMAAGFPLPSG